VTLAGGEIGVRARFVGGDPFPARFGTSKRATADWLDKGPHRIAFTGDSARGNLALALLAICLSPSVQRFSANRGLGRP
jgi:hypothetical protein